MMLLKSASGSLQIDNDGRTNACVVSENREEKAKLVDEKEMGAEFKNVAENTSTELRFQKKRARTNVALFALFPRIAMIH